MKVLSFCSVFLAGVLLDIQQHFGVKDSGAGLLQTGKSICFLAGLVTLLISEGCFQISSLKVFGTFAVKCTLTRKKNEDVVGGCFF